MTPAKLTVLVTGARDWAHPAIVEAVILGFEQVHGPHLAVIVGDASGADSHARAACNVWRIPHRVFAADWPRFGNGAGPRRNRAMLDALEQASGDHMVVGFHSDLAKSKGTLDCVTEARRRGLAVYVVGAG
jgi:hypothetical protein